jgi:hypothetical protein
VILEETGGCRVDQKTQVEAGPIKAGRASVGVPPNRHRFPMIIGVGLFISIDNC